MQRLGKFFPWQLISKQQLRYYWNNDGNDVSCGSATRLYNEDPSPSLGIIEGVSWDRSRRWLRREGNEFCWDLKVSLWREDLARYLRTLCVLQLSETDTNPLLGMLVVITFTSLPPASAHFLLRILFEPEVGGCFQTTRTYNQEYGILHIHRRHYPTCCVHYVYL
jgi:hypothetical protein